MYNITKMLNVYVFVCLKQREALLPLGFDASMSLIFNDVVRNAYIVLNKGNYELRRRYIGIAVFALL